MSSVAGDSAAEAVSVDPESAGAATESGADAVTESHAGGVGPAWSGRGLWSVIQRHFGAGALTFVIVAGLFGGLFSVVTPPFWGHDEITQFGRAFQVAHGGFAPHKIHDDRGVAYGGDISVSIDAEMDYAFHDYNHKPEEPDPIVVDPSAYDALGAQAVSKQTKTMWFTNTAAYSPVPYIPAAVAIRTAQALDLNVGSTIELTRLAGLAAYLLIVGFALRSLRGYRVQWLAFTVSVLPIALFQAGTVTADTVTNALAILVSCLLVKGLFLGAKLTRPELVAAMAATVLLPLSKPTYVLLAMLTVVIPANRYGLRAWRRWVPWGFAALGAGLFAVWMKKAAPTGDGMGLMRPAAQWHSVRPGDQLHHILSNPAGFTGTFFDSIWLRDQRWFTQFFGELGFAYVDVPALSIVACLLALAVSVGVAERISWSPATRVRTWIVALTVAASVAMIYVTLYMSFSPVDYYLIDGVQGRYFVPLAIAFFAVLLRWMPLRLSDARGKIPAVGPAVTVVVAAVIALSAALIKYNYFVWG